MWRASRRSTAAKPWPYREGTYSNQKFAYNGLEASNTQYGITGNSISHAQGTYPAGWSMQPVRGNPVVRMWEEADNAGNLCYSFEYANAEEGMC